MQIIRKLYLEITINIKIKGKLPKYVRNLNKPDSMQAQMRSLKNLKLKFFIIMICRVYQYVKDLAWRRTPEH